MNTRTLQTFWLRLALLLSPWFSLFTRDPRRSWGTLGWVGVVSLFLYAPQGIADFSVNSPQQSSQPYGNAQTTCFKQSIEGGGTVNQAEQDALLAYLPQQDYNRFYARFRLNAGRLALTKLKANVNVSNSLGSVQNNGASTSQVGLELALGYAFDPNFRMDLEFLANKTLNYQANPAFSAGGIMTADYKSTALLGNLFFDITGFDSVKPYFFGSLGLTTTRSHATLDQIPGRSGERTIQRTTISWGLGTGLRYAIFKSWYIDFGARYIQFDAAARLAPRPYVELKGNYSMTAFSLGLIYFF